MYPPDTCSCGRRHPGRCADAVGCNTLASGACSHAEGRATVASGFASHAEGARNTASGGRSHVEGGGIDERGHAAPNEARGSGSHAEGVNTLAAGFGAHAEGGTVDVTVGPGSQALGDFSHAEGQRTLANGISCHAEGGLTIASGLNAHAEGLSTVASNISAHAEGSSTTASGSAAHAEGEGTTAFGEASHAEGDGTRAIGLISHAEGGFGNTASGRFSHVEAGGADPTGRGAPNLVSGPSAHAEGVGTLARGFASHAEGGTPDITVSPGPRATGDFAHAEGGSTVASGDFSHAEGLQTSTGGLPGSHIMGQYGTADAAWSWHLGNGIPGTPGLAARIDAALAQGIATNGWVAGPADYAEMFETVDGKPIDVGYFTAISGDDGRVRKANSRDADVLGITSVAPAFLADAHELEWKDKWLRDEWGRWLLQEVTIPPVLAEDGSIVTPERTERQRVVNPDYDGRRSYVPRSRRPEWVAVGLLGKLRVRDDGTCHPGGRCRPNDAGVATNADTGYRVLQRTGPNQVLVLFRAV